MGRATRLGFLLLLLAGVGRAQFSEGEEKPRRYGANEALYTDLTYRFRHARVSCTQVRDSVEEPRHFWRFGAAGIGRFSSSFFVPHGTLLAPDEAWLVDTGQGRILARAAMPVADADVRLTVDMAEVDGCPNWLFFRLRTTGPQLPSYIVAARTRGFSAKMGGTSSRLFLAWPDGVRGEGEPPPWNGRAPQFDALAFFARGSEADLGSDLMVFQPETCRALSMQRWDSVAILVFQPAADCRETLFALGTDPERNAEGLTVPQFMEGGRERLVAVMEGIVWEPPAADFTRVRALRQEVADLLARYPEPALVERFHDLEGRADALTATDLAAVAPLEADLRDLAEAAAANGLKTLFGQSD